jgi:hypothetical protein
LWRNPYSNFHEGETQNADEVYTTDYLESLDSMGFDAVWVRGILRDLVRTDVFPDLGDDPGVHREALGTVCERGRGSGIGLWLYLQPPLALSATDPFWDDHPDVAGATRERLHHEEPGEEVEMTALCVSHPAVRRFLREGFETLSEALPGLDGVILITASEFMQHCYTAHNIATEETTGCERCDRRTPEDVIGDIVGCAKSGFDRSDDDADIVAWNWSWNHYYDDPQTEILEELPEDVTLMAGFERGGTTEILGESRTIDEYSLGFAGPSERFDSAIEAGRDRGMDVMAKLQIATTHELATVPNLPVIGTIYDKVLEMRERDVDHVMGCWNFGNMLCSNTAAFTRFFDADPLQPRQDALQDFAREYFPGGDAEGVVDAWGTFAAALDNYPFCQRFIYYGPLNHALVRPIEPAPLDDRPVGRSWIPRDTRGEELEQSFGPYTLSEIITGLDRLQRTWRDGVGTFERALSECSSGTATEELHTARVAGHCFHSGWNLYRAYDRRREWDAADTDAVRAIMRDERNHLRDVLPIVDADDRMGFHSGCQAYMFDADGIRRKIREIDSALWE